MGAELTIDIVARLVLSSVVGGVIGLEREIHGRPAGFRTHLLVSLGSCLFCITSIEIYRIYGDFSGKVPFGVDPGRIAAQVVSGIGFLGAGAIIRERASVRGLTTAACLWVAAALGLACGMGLYFLAICVTGIALISLMLLKKVERMLQRDRYVTVKVWGQDSIDFISRATAVLATYGIDAVDAKYEKNLEQQRLYLEFQAKRPKDGTAKDLLASLSLLEGVRRVRVD